MKPGANGVPGQSPASLSDLLKEHLLGKGVDLGQSAPPLNPLSQTTAALFYADPKGIVYVRNTLAELEKIEKAIQQLNQPPQQVTIDARIIAITPEAVKKVGLDWFMARSSDSDRPAVGHLNRQQAQAMLKTMQARAGIDFIASPKVTTVTGREAMVSVSEKKKILEQGSIRQVEVGPSLRVTPVDSAERSRIQLTLHPKLVEVVENPQRASGRAKAKGATAVGADSPVAEAKIQIRETNAKIEIDDGHTVVIGIPPAEGMATDNQVYFFVTATMIDPAGNPIRP